MRSFCQDSGRNSVSRFQPKHPSQGKLLPQKNGLSQTEFFSRGSFSFIMGRYSSEDAVQKILFWEQETENLCSD